MNLSVNYRSHHSKRGNIRSVSTNASDWGVFCAECSDWQDANDISNDITKAIGQVGSPLFSSRLKEILTQYSDKITEYEVFRLFRN